jgi:hypothetical protein
LISAADTTAAAGMTDSLSRQMASIVHDLAHLHELFSWQTSVFGVLVGVMVAAVAILAARDWFVVGSLRRSLQAQVSAAKADAKESSNALSARLEQRTDALAADHARMTVFALERLQHYDLAFEWAFLAACLLAKVGSMGRACEFAEDAKGLLPRALGLSGGVTFEIVASLRDRMKLIPDSDAGRNVRDALNGILADLRVESASG